MSGSAGWIDTHCHLASHRFGDGEEASAAIARARAAGVERMVTLATCFGDFAAHAALAAAHPEVAVCLGIHPCDVHSLQGETADWPQRLATLAREHQAAAIGETGLDYYHAPPEGWSEDGWRKAQMQSLRSHFEVAEQCGLGIVLHTRDRSGTRSVEDALAVARDFAGRVRPLFHCFLGPVALLAPILELDGFVSFGGILTFPSAASVREAAAATPDSALLVETDAPYLAPVPHRGKRNEPAFVRHTGEALAQLRGVADHELAAVTSENARRFFRDGSL